jgi:hypothetical protein
VIETRWRQGRRVGRTVYLQAGPEPSDDDLLIGLMDTPALARRVVDAVNAYRPGLLTGSHPSRGDATAELYPEPADMRKDGR